MTQKSHIYSFAVKKQTNRNSQVKLRSFTFLMNTLVRIISNHKVNYWLSFFSKFTNFAFHPKQVLVDEGAFHNRIIIQRSHIYSFAIKKRTNRNSQVKLRLFTFLMNTSINTISNHKVNCWLSFFYKFTNLAFCSK